MGHSTYFLHKCMKSFVPLTKAGLMYFGMDQTIVKKRMGDFIASELERTNLNQTELGKLTKIHVSDINRYLHGETMPGHDRFLRICKAFGRSAGRAYTRVFEDEN